MADNRSSEQPEWLGWLEIVGPAMFLRYRKRVQEPGILWVMRQEYPELSYPDLAVRLFAARQLVDSGYELIALRGIRSGEHRVLMTAARARRVASTEGCGDRLSALLVGLGGALALCFVLLVLVAALGMNSLGALIVAAAALVFVGQGRPVDLIGLGGR